MAGRSNIPARAPARIASFSGAGGATLDASGSGPLQFTNTGAIFNQTVQAPVNFVLTGSNTGNNTFSPVISNSGTAANITSLVKNGPGTWVVTANNPYTGTTTVNGGTLVVSGSLTGTTAVSVNNSGSVLELGAPNALNNAVTLTLNNGTFDANGKSETIASLTSTGNSTLDLGIGATSILHFANSSAQSWSGSLTILDWNGSSTGGGSNELFFGSNASGLTAGQIAMISFLNPTIDGVTETGSFDATLLSDGELVATAVPEPGTWAMLVSASGLLLLIRRRR